jgi:hypothetical protein
VNSRLVLSAVGRGRAVVHSIQFNSCYSSIFILKPISFIAAACLLLAGCIDDKKNKAETAALPPVAIVDATAHIDAEIPAESVSVRIDLVGVPIYAAAEDVLRVKLRVHNAGKTALVGSGTMPVNLGAMLMGPEGADTAPGARDFVRIPLPLIQPGSAAEVAGELPAARLIDLPIRFELVQEGVRWFNETGFDLGTYKRCDGNPLSLCDSAGATVQAE